MSIPEGDVSAPGTYFVETYGCQMNVNDTEIVSAILEEAGHRPAASLEEADILLVNTCAIRDNAEMKVWNRLREVRAHKRKTKQRLSVGVLGCMAERLKERLLEEQQLVDLVAGPDAYRDLPGLLRAVGGGDRAVNVQLSTEETYADVAPVRRDGGPSSFVSIMRGCNNMCAFCIVPFTRGRERSRPLPSIVDEVRRLVDDGYKEVVLLGQNVNSYHVPLPAQPALGLDEAAASGADADADPDAAPGGVRKRLRRTAQTADGTASAGYETAAGFRNMFRLRGGEGPRFADLLAAVADVDPELRVRFTSPHPKDFPDPVLDLIATRRNVCSALHMPAQSGSTSVLERMRRGYSREAYLALVDRVRATIPDVTISTDMIVGFCGETDSEHEDTVSLMRHVRYEQAFLFAYSMRERTHAHRRMQDDVPEPVKKARLQQIMDIYRAGAAEANAAEIGRRHLVLVEGPSRRSTPEAPQFIGRTDSNLRVVLDGVTARAHAVPGLVRACDAGIRFDRRVPLTAGAAPPAGVPGALNDLPAVDIVPGDYVVAEMTHASPSSLYGTSLARTTLTEYFQAVDRV